jgi:hypothetical protein
MPFDAETLDLLARTKEVRIETSRPGGPVHGAIIWIVVDGEDVFIRSFRGERGRWYRETLANPHVTIEAGDRRIEATSVSATDAESVRRCSEGFQLKYPKSKSTPMMLAEDILETTLRLDPA